jgi:2-(1,2-epoxy-1,2-dihydrophenyl)acetyl-CoA isomerase
LVAVRYELRGEVALLTLDRPERYNAISGELAEELAAAIGKAGSEARALVLTGAGRAFCAGADLSDLMDRYDAGDPALDRVLGDRFNPMVRAMIEAPVPTVGAINGVAAGAGMSLALACDIRIMSSEASILSAFIGLALIPDTGSTWLLVRHLGLSRALEFTATNRRMNAAEAEALGLARVVDAGEVLSAALDLAVTLAAGPTPAYVTNRQILFRAAAAGFDESLADEEATQGTLGRSPLHAEGVKAFLEKRKADFRMKGANPD